ncbi:MAG: 4a-hydroxytetrahydrobiopterin dehydratase [Flavobacteriales bacterium]|nr:4a-hydroxytetrahydrobiopterin dehydratase [Flavobacteriales bacterium]|tara:strand:- start:38 stop:358 length:321 start_codon:yes stop_codon:yes gene_type:complete
MLEKKTCIPCQGGIPPLEENEINKLMQNLKDGWVVEDNKKLKKEYIFDQYMDAIKFTNQVAELSENEGHHPYIHINFKRVTIILFTHKIDGLHENDFIMAVKCDKI